ncbi:hypothetical protein [Brevibacillus centrosporus]|uniref:hypothetical protein n=1 Tax=Brevibacillus centrosporus TaxID=54910 RepID=UPI0037F1638A
MKRIIILFLCIFVLLFLIDIGTSKSGSMSGNGNLAILFEVPLAGFLLFFARDWYRWLRHRILSKSSKMLIAILSIVFLLYGSFHTYQEFTTYKPMLLEKMEKKYSREISPELFEAMTSGINVYTNSLYFNYVTFLMFVALINLWVLVSQML